jgi:CheY-like chemotaxis protein
MARLLDDLLDVSRITRNKLDLRREPVPLASVVSAAVEAARPSIEASHHELVVSLPDEALVVDGDPVRLAQVFTNLLTNSAKYTDRGGHLALRATREGDEVVVTVEDDGIGIAPEMLPRIFEMFAQDQPALQRAQGGLGIGLSLVRALVVLHGGRVEAHSEGVGRGTRMIVRLPLAERPAVVDAPEPARPSPGRCLRVLVADDNADAAETLAMFLSGLGHSVRTARDGVEALAVAEEQRPELVLLDLGMPRLNGLETARALRETPWGRAARIVAVTGWGHPDDRRRTAEARFDDHLVKPVELRELRAIVEALAFRSPSERAATA